MAPHGPFQLLHVDRADLAALPGPLEALASGEVNAIVVRGVLTAAEAGAVVEALEAAPDARGRLHAESGIEMVGRPLQWSSADLRAYLDQAEHVRATCARLFPEVPLLGRALETLELSARRPVHIAATEDGRAYAPMTLRRFPPGSFVGPHFELGQLGFPAYPALNERIDRATLFSFYVMLRPPALGGELAAYTLRWGEPDAARVIDAHDRDGALFGLYEPTLIAPAAGDLLLFDSGRHAHAVRRVGGPHARWTAGGLVAFERDHGRVLAWA